MKIIATTALATGLIMAPMVNAASSADQLGQILSAGTDYGITHFVEIEHKDGDSGRAEVEGWVGDDWLVELDMNSAHAITKEERRKRIDGPWGMTAEEVQLYINAAVTEGVVTIDEIKVDTSGYIEVEGYDASGRDLEVDFRMGSTQSVSVERDN